MEYLKTYESYNDEKSLDLLLEKYDKWSNNKIKQTNEIEWNDIDNKIDSFLKREIKNLSPKLKKVILILLNNTNSYIKKNIDNKEKYVKFVNSLINNVSNMVKNITLKRKIVYILLSLVLLVSNINLTIDDIDVKNKEIYPELSTIIDNHSTETIKDDNFYKEQLKSFLDTLSFKESSRDWKKINKYGYIGLYQFGKSALKDVGYKHINHRKFRKNPNIFPPQEQNKAIVKLLKLNKHYLRNYLHYDGKVINGIKINLSGMLGASHLVGNKSVKEFLSSNGKIDREDRNGTKCSDYMKIFNQYELDI